jgi:hypothetical protein
MTFAKDRKTRLQKAILSPYLDKYFALQEATRRWKSDVLVQGGI